MRKLKQRPKMSLLNGHRMIYIAIMFLLTISNVFLIYKSSQLLHEASDAIKDLAAKTEEMASVVEAYHEIMDPIMDKESRVYSFRFEPVEDKDDKQSKA